MLDSSSIISGRAPLATLLFVGLAFCGSIPTVIEINANKPVIEVGEPLILRLQYLFDPPLTYSDTNEPLKRVQHYASLDVEAGDSELSLVGYSLLGDGDIILRLVKNTTNCYAGHFVIWYFPAGKRLLFPDPGKYKITARGYGKSSNPIIITVKPSSKSMRQVLSLISDPYDWNVLANREYRDASHRKSVIQRFGQIIEKFPETTLSKWAAAALGFEFFSQFHERNPSFEKVLKMRKDGKPRDPLLERAMNCLQIAYGLPDEFPVREDVLYQLSRIHAIDGDFDKAMQLLNELEKKYPSGEYGRRAAEAKQELEVLMAR